MGINPSLNYDEYMSTKDSLNNQASGSTKAIETAVARLLRPLARLLITFQITLPVFQQWLKKAYIEIADEEFHLTDKPQTDTRISLLTGIHRKDIKRLRHQDLSIDSSPENISIGVQLASHWMGKDEFLDDNKQPLALPFKAAKDALNKPSFESLVEQVCKKDIRARVVLDEWLRLGVVTLDTDSSDGSEQIKLIPRAFVPSKSIDETAYFLGLNVADHLATATHNVINSQQDVQLGTAKFERCLFYDGLSENSVNELKQLANEQGMALLQSLNERALQLKQQDQLKDQLKDQDSTVNPSSQRINIGMYLFDEPDRS